MDVRFVAFQDGAVQLDVVQAPLYDQPVTIDTYTTDQHPNAFVGTTSLGVTTTPFNIATPGVDPDVVIMSTVGDSSLVENGAQARLQRGFWTTDGGGACVATTNADTSGTGGPSSTYNAFFDTAIGNVIGGLVGWQADVTGRRRRGPSHTGHAAHNDGRAEHNRRGFPPQLRAISRRVQCGPKHHRAGPE
jgi:hypothetical protein